LVAIVTLGTLIPPKTVTLHNVGTTALSITTIPITEINVGNFFQSHDCGSSLAAGASCTISVYFRPTAIGTRRAAVSITDSAAGSAQKVALYGTGGASGAGFCLVNSGNELTGYCNGQLGGIDHEEYEPVHCTTGQKGATT